jgi:hypothetical protein
VKKIKFESFRDCNGECPEFDNPHGWTQADLNRAFSLMRSKFSMAFNIMLMGMAHHLRQGPPGPEIKKLENINPRGEK